MFCFIEKLTPFYRTWKQTIENDVKAYTGLYSGLKRVADRTAKKPEKVLKEWCARTENLYRESQAAELCRQKIRPAAEQSNARKLRKAAARLLFAAKGAGIRNEETPGSILVLDERQSSAYINLNDGELAEGDLVEVISPAWYLGEAVVEQGYCRIQEEAS